MKPMWGEAFASDLLVGYDWWGYLQDDVLLGNLSASWGMAAAEALAAAGVRRPWRGWEESGARAAEGGL